jgi:hypothetical protein
MKEEEGKRITKIMAVISAMIVAIMTVPSTTAVVLAQQPPPSPPLAAAPPTGTELVDSERIIEQIRDMLLYSRLEDYRLYQNGTAEYTIRLTDFQGAPLAGNKTIIVITEHRYTAANGYVFDNATGDIITPEGEKLVISTFD